MTDNNAYPNTKSGNGSNLCFFKKLNYAICLKFIVFMFELVDSTNSHTSNFNFKAIIKDQGWTALMLSYYLSETEKVLI